MSHALREGFNTNMPTQTPFHAAAVVGGAGAATTGTVHSSTLPLQYGVSQPLARQRTVQLRTDGAGAYGRVRMYNMHACAVHAAPGLQLASEGGRGKVRSGPSSRFNGSVTSALAGALLPEYPSRPYLG